MKLANRKPVVFGVVAAFLLVIFLQMFLMARDNSATFDEPFIFTPATCNGSMATSP
jgi:hypothetical protein